MAIASGKDNNMLGFLGEDFQYKVVHEFVEDKEFFKDLQEIINQNLFTDPNLRQFVGVMRDYYQTEQHVPGYDMMKILLKERSNTQSERDFYDSLVDKVHRTSSEGNEHIRQLTQKFFKQQNLIRVANEILKISAEGDVSKYDMCEELVHKALIQGSHQDLGSGVFDDEGETLSDDYRTVIPTGIGKIDETLEGGLGKGELGVIVGPSSFGKTSLTTAMASYAATYKSEQNNNDGYKVLQIVFEDRIKQIQRKHYGRITGVESKDLSKPEYIEKVKEQLANYPDKEMLQRNLRIIRLPSGEKTAWDIEALIKRLISNGFRPDLVIVDYFECLEHKSVNGSDNEWKREGKTMRKFESMAGELNMAFWIPVQGTRDSVSAELVTMDKAGGSFQKIQIAHIVMTIARTIEDIEENLATIAILKNRAGKAGKVFNNVEFNNGTCRISTDNVSEFGSMVEFNKKRESDMRDKVKDIFNSVAKRK